MLFYQGREFQPTNLINRQKSSKEILTPKSLYFYHYSLDLLRTLNKIFSITINSIMIIV